MKVNIRLSVLGELLKEATIEIDDYKMEELTEEEKEGAIEILVRDWAARSLQIEWEAAE
ncbi:hypothetical protein [Paenibacillus silviterrae]|uniref:hypothetical protein n=1 Tax=Paenibacillus silviterrae TaxID=3242194 RepID=UPI002542993F|nr:hypothetical protein [Paenibacillus chinjuensis]